jgi:hypothetical protein
MPMTKGSSPCYASGRISAREQRRCQHVMSGWVEGDKELTWKSVSAAGAAAMVEGVL